MDSNAPLRKAPRTGSRWASSDRATNKNSKAREKRTPQFLGVPIREQASHRFRIPPGQKADQFQHDAESNKQGQWPQEFPTKPILMPHQKEGDGEKSQEIRQGCRNHGILTEHGLDCTRVLERWYHQAQSGCRQHQPQIKALAQKESGDHGEQDGETKDRYLNGKHAGRLGAEHLEIDLHAGMKHQD